MPFSLESLPQTPKIVDAVNALKQLYSETQEPDSDEEEHTTPCNSKKRCSPWDRPQVCEMLNKAKTQHK